MTELEKLRLELELARKERAAALDRVHAVIEEIFELLLSKEEYGGEAQLRPAWRKVNR